MLLCLGLLVHVSNGRGLIEMLISGVFDKTIRRVGIDLEEERCYTEPGVWFDRARRSAALDQLWRRLCSSRRPVGIA